MLVTGIGTTGRGRGARWASAIAVLALVLAAVSADARPSRVAQLPNGAVLGCGGCHVSPSGGGVRNSFGLQIESDFLTASGFSGEVIWGPELAALDADGDGASNGLELGDPEGAWRVGDAAPGDADAVTQPWNADSFPPPAPTAVAASSWADVKALMRSTD